MSIYGINIDWKEGTFSLLEALSDNQGEKPVTVKFDYDSEIETATINLVDTQYVFHHYPMGSDGFDTELVRIEHILQQDILFGYIRTALLVIHYRSYSFRQMNGNVLNSVIAQSIFLHTSFRMENNLLFLRLLLQS